MTRPRQVAVIGAGRCDERSEPWGRAEEVGRGLAKAGIVVICGGAGGVMEAVARGASDTGGTVIGILPGEDPEQANPYLSHVVASGVGHARNLAVVASGDAVIAIGGEWGTLTEIAFARRLGRPVAALDSWAVQGQGELADAPGVVKVQTAAEAVASALGALRG